MNDETGRESEADWLEGREQLCFVVRKSDGK